MSTSSGSRCAPARHDRDVVEPVGPPSGLADPDLDFHPLPPAKKRAYRPLSLTRGQTSSISGTRIRCARKPARMRAVAPHTVSPGELEEVHRALGAEELPPLLVVHLVAQQLGERDVEHALDLAGRGECRGPLDEPDERREQERPETVCSCRARRSRRPSRGARSPPPPRGARRRGRGVEPWVELAAGEGDLALVATASCPVAW